MKVFLLFIVICLITGLSVALATKPVEPKVRAPYYKVGEIVHLDHFDMENCRTVITSSAVIPEEGQVYATSTACGTSPFQIVDYVSEEELRNGKMQATTSSLP